MKFTAKEIAEMLNGVVEGDADIILNKLSKIEEGFTNSLSFLKTFFSKRLSLSKRPVLTNVFPISIIKFIINASTFDWFFVNWLN